MTTMKSPPKMKLTSLLALRLTKKSTTMASEKVEKVLITKMRLKTLGRENYLGECSERVSRIDFAVET